MGRWTRLWRRVTRLFDVDAVPVTVVDDMAPDPDGWSAGYVSTAGTGYRTVAKRLPMLVATSIRLAAEASRARTVALLLVQAASSVAGAFGLYATTDVLAPLFGAGATPDRIRARCRRCWWCWSWRCRVRSATRWRRRSRSSSGR
ncbi:hypothetical protein ACFQ9X_26345 [Catenulispora yoronensis]